MYLIIPSLLPLFMHFFVLFVFMLAHADLSMVDNMHLSINGGVRYYSIVVFLSHSDA